MDKFQVIVSNVGTVHSGGICRFAEQQYAYWVRLSKGNCSRASGESVTLMERGEIRAEYAGQQVSDG